MTRSAIDKLLIPYVGNPLLQDNQAIGSLLKKEGSLLAVDKINWPEYPYKPVVKLLAGYSDAYLFLYYEVEKDFYRVHALADQEAVWEDSCVEFFISTDESLINNSLTGDSAVYQNFEFNALGYCLSARGNKQEREPLASAKMERVLRSTSLNLQNLPEEGAEFNWQLSVSIPLDLIGIQPGSIFRANFYKCGDLTSKPHFLSWNRIDSASPDFHLPQFFGEAELAVRRHKY
jgi:hypothetical protein